MDLIRCLLQDLDQIDDFTGAEWFLESSCARNHDVLEWLWVFSTGLSTDEEKLRLQNMLLRCLAWRAAVGELLLSQSVARLLDSQILKRIQEGRAGLLEVLLEYSFRSIDSEAAGTWFVMFLQHIGVDVFTSISKELELYEGEVVKSRWSPGKKVTLQQKAKNDFLLRWDYAFEDSDPSTPFMAEFTVMTVEPTLSDTWFWPFNEVDWSKPTLEENFKQSPEWQARFTRRAAIKAAKQAGQFRKKKPRSKMPGAW